MGGASRSSRPAGSGDPRRGHRRRSTSAGRSGPSPRDVRTVRPAADRAHPDPGARVRTRQRRCRAGATTREHVEGGDDLGQQAGMPVGHSRDEEAEGDGLGVAGHEPERRVPLQHRVRGRSHLIHLEPVIHQCEPRHADLLGCPRRGGQCRGDRLRRAREVEADVVDADTHAVNLRATERSVVLRRGGQPAVGALGATTGAPTHEWRVRM